MRKDNPLKKIYQVTHQHGNCKTSNKIVVILTDYHPAKSTTSLKIVQDGGPNVALGQASAILLTSKGMYLPCEISFV